MSENPTKILALFGGGEHARVVAEAAEASGWRVLGFIGAGQSLGDDTQVESLRQQHPELRFHLGIGNLRVRERLALQDLPWATVIHPSAVVSPSARLEAGAFVGARAVVQTGAQIGAHAILNTGSIVEHDGVVGRGAHLCPGAVLGGGVQIGAGAQVGLGASVRDHLRVGKGAVVGMGAAVIREVADGTTVWGVPARRVAP